MVKPILTTYEAAKYSNVTMTTVVNWIKDGSLKAYKTKGGHRRIKTADLLDFLKKYDMPVFINQRILVVDDDVSIQTGLKKVFESHGYEVSIANNGFEAGVLIEMKRPALIVLDLVMPELDGFYVCEFIKKHDHLQDTKIIVLSGYPSQENIEKAKKSGADAFISKPAENRVIIEEARRLLKDIASPSGL